MSAILVGVVVYILVQFAIGVWASRRISDESDYILAGRQVGLAFGAFSVFATWFGAETVLGSGGSVYEGGLSAAQGEPFAYGLAIVVMGLVLAGPLRRRGLTTFADLFAERYSRGVEQLVVVLLVPGSILWTAAQIRGFGQVLSATAGVDVTVAIVAAFVVVVAYTMLGGLLADIYTDFLQGLAIVAGLLAVFVMVVIATGSPFEMVAQAAREAPERVAFIGPEQGWLEFAEEWAIPICGSLVALELISRILAMRAPEVAQRACVFGGLGYIAVALVPVYLGLIGPGLVPGLENSEQIIPKLAETYLPTILFIMFAGALISAILSTIDSALLACSAMISHNVVQPLRPKAVSSERAKVLLARAGVAGLGTIAFLLALSAGSISDLVELASAFATAGIFVVTMFAVFTSIGGPLAAYATVITGGVVWAAGDAFLNLTAPYATAVVCAALVYPLVAAFERGSSSRA